jgi:threonine synthase
VKALKAGIPAERIRAEPHPSTIASGLEDPFPWDADCSMEGVARTNGLGESVTDLEILDAVRDLARYEGIFAEPSGAAALAGTRKLRESGAIDSADTTVVLVTGSGLKDIEALRKLVGPVPVIEPTMSELGRVLLYSVDA